MDSVYIVSIGFLSTLVVLIVILNATVIKARPGLQVFRRVFIFRFRSDIKLNNF